MSRRELTEAQITFHDASDYFSREEWTILHGWQKELYRNVMEEIHKALLSLGPLIATTILSLVAKEKEALCRINIRDSERRHRINHCSVDSWTNPEVPFKINEDENVHQNKRFDPEQRKRNNNLSTESPLFKSEVPVIKQEVAASILVDDLEEDILEHCKNPNSAAYEAVSISISDEEETYCLDRKRTESIKRPSGDRKHDIGGSATQTMIPPPSKLTPGTNPVNRSSSYEKETHSENQLWADLRNPLTGAELMQLESGSSDPPHLSFYQETARAQRTDTFIGERQYHCLECEKTFRRKDNLLVHQRTHTGERPYRCTMCQKSFNQKSILNRHLITHTEERHFQCDQCNKSFSQNRILTAHQKLHHYPKTD